MSFNIFIYCLIPSLGPAMFQRILMAKDVYQSRQAFTYAAGINTLILAVVAWLAILLRTSNADLEPSSLILHVVDTYAYVGLKGVIVVGVMALAMSTADSELNASSVLATHDLLRLLFPSLKVSVTLARISSALIGVAGLALALQGGDMLQLILTTVSFYRPIVTVPLLLAIFGFRSSPRACLAGMVAGASTVFVWNNYFAYTEIPSFLPGMLANFSVLTSLHYLLDEETRVKVLEKDKGKTSQAEDDEINPLFKLQRERRERWEMRWEALRTFDLTDYLISHFAQEDRNYFLLGLYIIAATYLGFYLIDEPLLSSPATHVAIRNGISYIALTFTALLLTLPIWSASRKDNYLYALLWLMSIWLLLFVCGPLMILLSDFHISLILVLAVSLFLSVLLLHWPLALCLASSGIASALIFFYRYTGTLNLPKAITSLQYDFVYAFFMLTILFVAIIIGQELYRNLIAKYHKLDIALANLQDENRQYKVMLESLFVENTILKRSLQKAKANEFAELVHENRYARSVIEDVRKKVGGNTSEELSPASGALHSIDTRLTEAATHLVDLVDRSNHVPLDVLHVRMEDFVQRIEILLDFRQEKKAVVHQCSEFPEIQCDVEKMINVALDSVQFVRKHVGSDVLIRVVLERTRLRYPLNSIQNMDYVKEIDALRWTITTESILPSVSPTYTAKLAHKEPDASLLSQGEEMVMAQRVVDAHYGYWELMPQGLLYVIPVELSQVRPEDMDIMAPGLDSDWERADDTYPGAKEAEEALIAAVSVRSDADIALVRDAIDLIKDYHGPVKRKSGEPFYLHPIAIAQIVLDYNQDEATILGALLHDTVEDTPLSLDQLEVRFNKEVRQIVDGVTHLDSAVGGVHRIKLEDTENLLQLMSAKDQRILYIKIADRMHNMRTIQFKKYASQLKKANETIQFFVPLCKELGLKTAARELEELCTEVFKNGRNQGKK